MMRKLTVKQRKARAKYLYKLIARYRIAEGDWSQRADGLWIKEFNLEHKDSLEERTMIKITLLREKRVSRYSQTFGTCAIEFEKQVQLSVPIMLTNGTLYLGNKFSAMRLSEEKCLQEDWRAMARLIVKNSVDRMSGGREPGNER